MFHSRGTGALVGATVAAVVTAALVGVPGASAVGPSPIVTSISPTAAAVGAEVTITGTNLDGATAVTFNFNAAPIVTDTDTEITTTVPLGDDDGPVAVTTPGGTAESSSTFTLTGFYVATTSLPPAQRGALYHVQLQTAGGTGPYHWTKSTPLPKGLTMTRQGVVSGVPQITEVVPGTYPLTVKVRDSTKHGHQTATASLSLTVN